MQRLTSYMKNLRNLKEIWTWTTIRSYRHHLIARQIKKARLVGWVDHSASRQRWDWGGQPVPRRRVVLSLMEPLTDMPLRMGTLAVTILLPMGNQAI